MNIKQIGGYEEKKRGCKFPYLARLKNSTLVVLFYDESNPTLGLRLTNDSNSIAYLGRLENWISGLNEDVWEPLPKGIAFQLSN